MNFIKQYYIVIIIILILLLIFIYLFPKDIQEVEYGCLAFIQECLIIHFFFWYRIEELKH